MRGTVSLVVAVIVVLAVSGTGCGRDEAPIATINTASPPTLDLDGGGVVGVGAAPELGFHHAYYLLWPPGLATADAPTARQLLVVPSNTGAADDDLAVHDASVRQALRSHGAALAASLPAPLLMPVFPRPLARWRIYTHALDRDAMTLPTDDPLARLDLQLIAMIDHARQLLAASGVEVADDVLLFGFSASGTFVNRFAALHPERVRAVAAGGINALPILPLTELEGHALPYPIGIADLEALTGRPFAAAAWREIPQLVFMGAEDVNDTLPYGDAWDDNERELIGAVLGERMMPQRWERVQMLLSDVPGLALRTYAGRGHEVTDAMIDDVQAHFRAAAAR